MFHCMLIAGMLIGLSACSEYQEHPRDVQVADFSCVEGAYAIKLPPKLKDLRRMSQLEREEVGHPDAKPGWQEYRTLYFQDLKVLVTTVAKRRGCLKNE